VSAQQQTAPLVIGETFTIDSKVLGEARGINVYLPPGYVGSESVRLLVLYMPDDSLGEAFLQVARIVQVSVGNGSMRLFILVDIENTERRRDMTAPTADEQDKKIAPHVGGSAGALLVRSTSHWCVSASIRAGITLGGCCQTALTS
jgi:enterochelin esterase-like enzyme